MDGSASKALCAALVVSTALSMASAGFAQGNRSWVDPPAEREDGPPAAAPAPAPAPAPSPSPPAPVRRPAPVDAGPRSPSAAPPARSEEAPRPALPKRQEAPEPPRVPPDAQPSRPSPAARLPEIGPDTETPPETARRRRTPAEPAARPAPDRRRLGMEDVVEQFAVDYLAFWSAPNAVTLEAIPDFYAPVVSYHGRRMSAREVFGEKLRFVRRWPQRRYTPRTETLRVSCASAAQFCSVRTAFDFAASNPERGTSSSGVGTVELGVSVAGERPRIVQERSSVARRGRPGPRFEALDGGR